MKKTPEKSRAGYPIELDVRARDVGLDDEVGDAALAKDFPSLFQLVVVFAENDVAPVLRRCRIASFYPPSMPGVSVWMRDGVSFHHLFDKTFSTCPNTIGRVDDRYIFLFHRFKQVERLVFSGH